MSWVTEVAETVGTVGDVIEPFITTADEAREHEQLMAEYQKELKETEAETKQVTAQSQMIQTAVLGLAGISVFGMVIYLVFN